MEARNERSVCLLSFFMRIHSFVCLLLGLLLEYFEYRDFNLFNREYGLSMYMWDAYALNYYYFLFF